jgi:hypothetical protein
MYPDMPRLKQYTENETFTSVKTGERERKPLPDRTAKDMIPAKGPDHDAEVTKALENLYPVKP